MSEQAASPVVLITGAARRIGAAISRHLHQRGVTVAIHYRGSAGEAQALAAGLERIRPDGCSLHQADLIKAEAPQALVSSVLERWGRLDGLINNASTFYPTAVGSITPAQWDDLIGSNLKAPLFLSQAAAVALAESSGSIVNIIDIHAERPMKGYPVYSIAKAGLAMLTRTLARELAPEVRVNGVAPGAILWPEAEMAQAQQAAILERIALRRAGHPHDIATTAAFLLLDAPYITGQIVAVDGGRTLQF